MYSLDTVTNLRYGKYLLRVAFTAEKILERLGIQTSSSFVKI
jgi:hypothetical protein